MNRQLKMKLKKLDKHFNSVIAFLTQFTYTEGAEYIVFFDDNTQFTFHDLTYDAKDNLCVFYNNLQSTIDPEEQLSKCCDVYDINRFYTVNKHKEEKKKVDWSTAPSMVSKIDF